MPDKMHFDRRLVTTSAVVCGVLLALAVHMLGQSLGLDFAELWLGDIKTIPIQAAAAWWLVAAVAFGGGYITTVLLEGTAAGRIPQPLWWVLIGGFVLILAAAGQLASAPSTAPGSAGVLGAVAAFLLGAAMALCGIYVAPRA